MVQLLRQPYVIKFLLIHDFLNIIFNEFYVVGMSMNVSALIAAYVRYGIIFKKKTKEVESLSSGFLCLAVYFISLLDKYSASYIFIHLKFVLFLEHL